jgi:hypothetical protein
MRAGARRLAASDLAKRTQILQLLYKAMVGAEFIDENINVRIYAAGSTPEASAKGEQSKTCKSMYARRWRSKFSPTSTG